MRITMVIGKENFDSRTLKKENELVLKTLEIVEDELIY